MKTARTKIDVYNGSLKMEFNEEIANFKIFEEKVHFNDLESCFTIVITVSCSTWKTSKINEVATDLFCMGVIGHPGCMFLN